MPRTVDYYFSTVSPWAYIGYAPFLEIVRKHGLSVNHKPVTLGKVFAETGGLPLGQRHPVRQRYRLVELQRWRDRRGLSFKVQPKHWPFDATLADRFVIGIAASNQDPAPFLKAAFAGIWEQERNLGDPLVIAEIAERAGFDSTALMERALGSTTEAIYALNLENAVAADVFGSPAYVLDGEVFWGQDRLDLLADALDSGRQPYRPDTAA